MTALSILELVRVRGGSDASTALAHAQELGACAEELGYKRIWVAEHHNMPGIASAATSLVISHIASATRHIRVGAGGIMLPNHAPYIIAEQFGTLAALYPGRIDLGLGRAPGTDGLAVRAMRRSPASSEHFPRDVIELQSYFEPADAPQPLVAVPAPGQDVEFWILGSSTFGALLAAELGLPYGFASHFAPQQFETAIELYRRNFKPSARLAKPYLMVGANVIAADTDAEAKRLQTTQLMSFTDLFRGARGLSKPPIDDIEDYWSPAEKRQVMSMLAYSVAGSQETVGNWLQQLVAQTGADELILVSDIFDQQARLHSHKLIMDAMQGKPA